MREPSPRLFRDLVESLRASSSDVLWIDPDDYAGVVQVIVAANGMSHLEAKAMLAAPGLRVGDDGYIKRYEWVS